MALSVCVFREALTIFSERYGGKGTAVFYNGFSFRFVGYFSGAGGIGDLSHGIRTEAQKIGTIQVPSQDLRIPDLIASCNIYVFFGRILFQFFKRAVQTRLSKMLLHKIIIGKSVLSMNEILKGAGKIFPG